MEVIVFDKNSYYKMQEEVITLMYKVIQSLQDEHQKNNTKEKNDFINTKEALQLMGLKSKDRLYKLRDAKLIDCFQHGRRILYSRRSIIKYLKDQQM